MGEGNVAISMTSFYLSICIFILVFFDINQTKKEKKNKKKRFEKGEFVFALGEVKSEV